MKGKGTGVEFMGPGLPCSNNYAYMSVVNFVHSVLTLKITIFEFTEIIVNTGIKFLFNFTLLLSSKVYFTPL